jgi:hypothetical protein
LAVLFIPFGIGAPKHLDIAWLSNLWILSVPDEGYSRNVPDEGYSIVVTLSQWAAMFEILYLEIIVIIQWKTYLYLIYRMLLWFW